MFLPLPLLAQNGRSQEVVWQLESHWTWAPWVTVVFITACVATVVYLYAREASPAGPAYRGLLIGLRLTSIALVLLMLSELLLSGTRSGLPRLVVLVDHSASMGLEDPSTSNNEANRTRLDAARELLLSDDKPLLSTWQEKYDLHLAAVADDLESFSDDEPAEWTSQLRQLDTDGPATGQSRLGDALATVIDDHREPPPTAVVLATDGRNNAGRSLDEARELARRRGVPLFVVGYGSATAPADVRLANLLADDVAFLGDSVAMGVTVQADSLSGQTVRVAVRDTATGDIMAEQQVEVSSNAFSETIELVLHPDREGQITYRVQAEPVEDERNLQNNVLQHTIDVHDETVQVLLAAGYPNYEFRYLKNLLDRDQSFDLTTYLQEADAEYAAQDATAVAQLPVQQDALDEFDVVILLDLNPRLLPPRWWQNVERHVAEEGGGLAMVAGPRYFPAQYADVATARTLAPVELQGSRRGGDYGQGFRPNLTALGQQSGPLQLGDSASESLRVWNALPRLYWYAPVDDLKPAARVWATHPDTQMPDGGPMPLLAEHYVGAGRVLYHGIDSTWRWRFRVGDVFFARYWGQTLRYLARGKLLEGDDRPEILVDRSQYDLGETVRLQLRIAGRLREEAPVELLLSAEGQPNRRISLVPSAAQPNLLEATLRNLAAGEYRVSVADADMANRPDAVEFTVVAPPGEMVDTTMNRAALEQLAQATYGKFYSAESAATLADDLPTGNRVPLEVLPPMELWNQWWVLMAITLCLSAEWILRKRRAML